MKSISAATAQREFLKVMDDVTLSGQPERIRGAKHAAVLVSDDDWRGIQETLYLYSIPGMVDSILAAMAEPLDESSEQLDW